MELRKICNIVLASVIAVSTAWAVPAKPGAIIRTMEDGTQKAVFLHGDAFGHYMTDEQGQWLDETTLLPLSEQAKAERQDGIKQQAQVRRATQEKKITGDLNLAPRGLLIMVNFADKKFVTPIDTIQNMINGSNFTRNYSYDIKYEGKTYHYDITSSGSAKQYFHDVSWGQYNPVFDVVGPVTISKEYAYYGKDYGRAGNDMHPDEMVSEACELADLLYDVDFTQYDNDNDGYVDFVYVLYAGYGQADGGEANTVWPHNYKLSYRSNTCIIDGKRIDNYACSNEIQYASDFYNGIGTFCHEFSHVLGLPDLYYTAEGTGPHTLCDWDILDAGPYNNDGNTPPAYSAYERFYMGWLTPRVLNGEEKVTLHPLNDSREALIMCEGNSHNLDGLNPNPATFYILENRVLDGWDKYLPGRGMLITKIQYNANTWYNNTVNNKASKMGVDIIEAKENTENRGKSSDAFPNGAKNFYGFADHDLENIKYGVNGTITFDFYSPYLAVEEVEIDQEQVHKMLFDGQLLIRRGEKTYDVLGREL